jgi:hypothetical protein
MPWYLRNFVYGENVMVRTKRENVFMTGSSCEGRPLDDRQLLFVFFCWLMRVEVVVKRVL